MHPQPTLPPLHHSLAMVDRHGMVQFAQKTTADLTSGYTLDDNVRALIVAIQRLHARPNDPGALRLGSAAFRYLDRARRAHGVFHNYVNEQGVPTDRVGSPESIGRTIWAFGVAAASSPVEVWRERARQGLRAAFPWMGILSTDRARAYAMLGLASLVEPRASILPHVADTAPADLRDHAATALRGLAEGLMFDFDRWSSDDWRWWDGELSYANARLPEAMLRAALALNDPVYAQCGLRAAEFLIAATQPDDTFVPIGAPGWYRRGQECPAFDQQPIEACGMTELWLAMHRWTEDADHLRLAAQTFAWYTGRNLTGVQMGDPRNGGCHDGLTRDGVNENMGAESSLSYLQSATSLALAGASATHREAA